MAFGVPVILQSVSIDAQAGRAVVPDFISQVVTLAPRSSKVVGVTENATPKLPEVPVADE